MIMHAQKFYFFKIIRAEILRTDLKCLHPNMDYNFKKK